MPKRRFRIRSKHYDYLMIGCILVGCAFVVTAFLKHRHHNGVTLRTPASIEPVAQANQQQLQGKLTQSQLEMRIYFSHAKQVLGESETGKLSYVLFLRGMVPQLAKDNPKLAAVCVSDQTCPVKLADLYKFAIGRFAIDKDLLARVYLQRDLLKSQMSADEKKAILAGFLLNPENGKIKPTSITKNGKVQVGRDVEYEILTISQYESLKPKPNELVGVVLKVAENSKDPIARQVMLQGLNKAYPKFSKDISTKASHLGVKLAAR